MLHFKYIVLFQFHFVCILDLHIQGVWYRFWVFWVDERNVKNAGLNGSKNSPCHEEYRFDLLLSVHDILNVAQFRIIY